MRIHDLVTSELAGLTSALFGAAGTVALTPDRALALGLGSVAGDAAGGRTVLIALVATTAILAVTGILQMATGTSAFASERYVPTIRDRSVGTMSSPAEFGLMLVTGISACVVLLRRASGPLRIAVGAIALLALVALVLPRPGPPGSTAGSPSPCSAGACSRCGAGCCWAVRWPWACPWR